MFSKRSKYWGWYYHLIKRAKDRQLVGYCEKHHIIPKCLGGSNDPSNIVALTAREHFLAHWLLIKFTKYRDDQRKMQHALFRLCQGKNGPIRAGWQYEIAKRAKSAAGMSAESIQKRSSTLKARGPSAKMLAHLAKLNARFRAEGGVHWKKAQSVQGPLTDKQKEALKLGRLVGKHTVTPKLQAHLDKITVLNRIRRTDKQKLQLSTIQQAPKSARQREALRRVHQLPKSAEQMAQFAKMVSTRHAQIREKGHF
jgi:hypothetical protein